MSNWGSRTLPNFNDHSRSASVAGYQDFLQTDHAPPKYDQSWMYRTSGPQYSSSVDISNNRADPNNYQRFSWRSPNHHPVSNSVSSYSEATDYSQKQRPFETAFKSAITKMKFLGQDSTKSKSQYTRFFPLSKKESSLSRLGVVDKNVPTAATGKSHSNSDSNEYYRRNCQTLQPSRTNPSIMYREDSGRKIFRCEPSMNRGPKNVYSVSPISKEVVSDSSEPDNIIIKDQNRYESTIPDDRNKRASFSSKTSYTYSNFGKDKKPGGSVIIPVKNTNVVSSQPKEPNLIKLEPNISPRIVKKNQSSIPQYMQDNDANDDPNCEPLPSVQEIISKVEALNNQSGSNIMSKSLNITHEKPPILISHKSTSQRTLDNFPMVIESPIVAQKKMSGLYKKNVANTAKSKSIANMPSDFQKLHTAFLDQKQEIQRLRHELSEKNALINQLEADLKNYEPWR